VVVVVVFYVPSVQYYSMKRFFSEIIVPTDSFSFILIFKKKMPRKCLEREHPRPFNKIPRVISKGDLTSRLRIVKVLTSVAEIAMHSAPYKSAKMTMRVDARSVPSSLRKSAHKLTNNAAVYVTSSLRKRGSHRVAMAVVVCAEFAPDPGRSRKKKCCLQQSFHP